MKIFTRHATQQLDAWYSGTNRQPLIVLGARQVGKTTLVHNFAKTKNLNYFYINLENPDNKDKYNTTQTIKGLLHTIEIDFNKSLSPNALIFFDEIQHAPHILQLLRFFKEQYPQYAVIASGSWLNVYLDRLNNDKNFSFPVGRVDFMTLFPLTFTEYLQNTNDTAYQKLKQDPIGIATDPSTHDIYNKKFLEYLLLGGMPYIWQSCNLTLCIRGVSAQKNLLNTIIKDIEKYLPETPNYTVRIFKQIFTYPAKTLTKSKLLPNVNIKTINKILDALHKAFLITPIYRTYSTQLPFKPSAKPAIKFLALDTGLSLSASGLTSQLLPYINEPETFFHTLEDSYKGKLAEQFVGQLLLATFYSNYMPNIDTLYYWENKNGKAEIDFVLPYNTRLIGIEVKSGKVGKLRSLFEFLNKTNNSIGIRIYGGRFQKEQTSLTNKPVYSIPFYLIELLPQVLERVNN